MSSVLRSTPALLRQLARATSTRPLALAPCTCSSPSSTSAPSRRLLSSSSRSKIASSEHRNEHANPSTLLTDHPVPDVESISRLEGLMRLGEKLSREANKIGTVPARLRGVGVYERGQGPPVPPAARDSKELPATRRMADSYVQMDLPFSHDEGLREQYVGGLSKVRMGRLMEDFDSLAGAAAYRYVLPDGAEISDASGVFFLVTAAVDRMDVLRPVANPDGSVPDIRLSAHVSYATSSSLEVFVRMSTVPTTDNDSETILLGRFAMACRSAQGGKFPVPELDVRGPEERAVWQMGKEMREGKTKRSQQSLTKTPPTADEAAMMHELFLTNSDIYDRKSSTPNSIVWMADTRVNSATLMHPQERNVHNKVFGGYLMRIAYETAYSTACLFARSAVTFVSLDELQFAQPVEIGSLLLLDSKVTFSPMRGEHRSFHVSVEAATCDLYTGERRLTNVFHWTFSSDRPLQRHVLPRSYRQTMQWLDAQRRRKVGIEVRKGYEQAVEP
ncbi:hypothetical protein JCM3775_004222 [Rhodotorula graminis]|uniref:HotDog ACOT-type domain-containing protein n=1 Tax=Rhodotorula graminis (strain WP1) TaxID=578459 RepID=A0A194SBQ6_RHOGW|nr:uncharacterized protein RHOBADRAFT_51825 [Rhodotorula graminis WP1]KPV76836.1 hypothetical protein RHOBADRAFT_51825 [Rhodotorula graminis WP1]